MSNAAATLTLGGLCYLGTEAGWHHVGWLWALFVVVVFFGLSVHASGMEER